MKAGQEEIVWSNPAACFSNSLSLPSIPQVPDIAAGPRLSRVPNRLVSRQPLAGERQQRQHAEGLGCQDKETGH